MSAVFFTVFCDYARIISLVPLVIVTFFVTAADRLLIICNTVVTCIIHLHSTLKIMCILAGRVRFRKTKRCTNMYWSKDPCSR